MDCRQWRDKALSFGQRSLRPDFPEDVRRREGFIPTPEGAVGLFLQISLAGGYPERPILPIEELEKPLELRSNQSEERKGAGLPPGRGLRACPRRANGAEIRVPGPQNRDPGRPIYGLGGRWVKTERFWECQVRRWPWAAAGRRGPEPDWASLEPAQPEFHSSSWPAFGRRAREQGDRG